MDRGERGIAAGPLFVEIGRVGIVMGTPPLQGWSRSILLLYNKCSSEAGRGKGGGDD